MNFLTINSVAVHQGVGNAEHISLWNGRTRAPAFFNTHAFYLGLNWSEDIYNFDRRMGRFEKFLRLDKTNKRRRCRVYYNFNRKLFSVLQCGIVVGHLKQLYLSDCRFIVNKGGLERCRRESRKNVHAFIEGDFCSSIASNVCRRWHNIKYDPYLNDAFIYNEKPIYNCDKLYLRVDDNKASIYKCDSTH